MSPDQVEGLIVNQRELWFSTSMGFKEAMEIPFDDFLSKCN